MLGLQRIEVAGKRFVLLEEPVYERLCRDAGEAVADDDVLPPLPKADANGRFPAIEYTRVSLARNLIRDRKSVGLSQERLAELAGIRQETISRLESGKHTATPGTIAKIDRVIAAARKRMSKAKGK
jgi:DNA-binding XRE family transcriptional regulator